MAQTYRSLTTLAAALCAALLVSGCPAPSRRSEPPSNPIPGPQSSEPVTPGPLAPSPPPRTPPAPRENHLSAATRSLVTQSRTLASRGDLDGASSTLDRALRIEPNNPLLWIELGRLRLRRLRSQAAIAARRLRRGGCSPMRCAPSGAIRKRSKSSANLSCADN
jgi:hypothetical protein